jgi:hypothetical protein
MRPVLEKYKVAFKDLTDLFQCAVVKPPTAGGIRKTVVPDHTVLFITCSSEDEAYFIAGVLNSVPARVALYCQSVGVQTQRYFTVDIARVQQLSFNKSEKLHENISRLSRAAHEAAQRGTGLEKAEEDIASCVGELWNINKTQLRQIHDLYRLLQAFRQSQTVEEDLEDEE